MFIYLNDDISGFSLSRFPYIIMYVPYYIFIYLSENSKSRRMNLRRADKKNYSFEVQEKGYQSDYCIRKNKKILCCWEQKIVIGGT